MFVICQRFDHVLVEKLIPEYIKRRFRCLKALQSFFQNRFKAALERQKMFFCDHRLQRIHFQCDLKRRRQSFRNALIKAEQCSQRRRADHTALIKGGENVEIIFGGFSESEKNSWASDLSDLKKNLPSSVVNVNKISFRSKFSDLFEMVAILIPNKEIENRKIYQIQQISTLVIPGMRVDPFMAK